MKHRNRRTYVVYTVLILALLGIGGGVYLALRGNPASAGTTAAATVTVTRGTVAASVSASGNVVSPRTLELSFSDSGTIATIPVRVGQKVTKGTVLSTLTDAAGDTVKLKAPMAGTVSSVAGVVGQTVGSGSGNTTTVTGTNATSSSSAASSSSSSTGSDTGTGFIELTDVAHLEIRAYFSEADILKLKVGQAATVSFDAIAGSSVRGTVRQIDPTSTVQNSVVEYGVTIDLRHQPAQLRLGQTATVQIVTERARNALSVPSAVVQTVNGRHVVTVVRSGGQVQTVVQIGVEGDQSTQILSGLSAGDEVVIPVSTGTNGFPSGGFPAVGGFGGGGPGGAGG
jgi:membrane fusion protein, macrolide-specific efflux system